MLDTLPDSQFAPWQLARLPEELQTILIGGANRSQSFLDFAKANRPSIPGRRTAGQPCMAVAATCSGDMRAFLMGKNQDKFGDGIAYAVEPAHTIGANEHGSKAFLMDSKNVNQEYGKRYRTGDEPAITVTTDGKPSHAPRAFDGGRVVAMTPRALARFQSFPDSYMLPDSKTLAAKGIGNAVPPLMYQKVIEGLLS